MDNETLIDSTLNLINSRNEDTIICVIDRSGSMGTLAQEATAGLNRFITEQAELANSRFTLIEFDNTIDVVYDNVDIRSVTDYELKPRGMTALYDAIGKACNTQTDSEKVIVLIVTDGHENSSREFNSEAVANLIKEREGNGWEFVFMGANQDAVLTGGGFGMSAARSVSYMGDGDGITRAFAAASEYSYTSRVYGHEAGEQYISSVNLMTEDEENLSN